MLNERHARNSIHLVSVYAFSALTNSVTSLLYLCAISENINLKCVRALLLNIVFCILFFAPSRILFSFCWYWSNVYAKAIFLSFLGSTSFIDQNSLYLCLESHSLFCMLNICSKFGTTAVFSLCSQHFLELYRQVRVIGFAMNRYERCILKQLVKSSVT